MGAVKALHPRFALCAFRPEATTSVHMWLDHTVVHTKDSDITVVSQHLQRLRLLNRSMCWGPLRLAKHDHAPQLAVPI